MGQGLLKLQHHINMMIWSRMLFVGGSVGGWTVCQEKAKNEFESRALPLCGDGIFGIYLSG